MPLLLEPVVATISAKNLDKYEVVVLDQDGQMTQKKVAV